MTVTLEIAVRQLLADYAGLQAEHQRLMGSPPDHASYEAHSGRLFMHVRRIQFVLDALRQELSTVGQLGPRLQ
jgi:hypothetical protein